MTTVFVVSVRRQRAGAVHLVPRESDFCPVAVHAQAHPSEQKLQGKVQMTFLNGELAFKS